MYRIIGVHKTDTRSKDGKFVKKVPLFRKEFVDKNKYTGERLRALRAKRGVGNVKHVKEEEIVSVGG